MLEILCGPLAEVECRRMLSSKWWLLVRWLAALPAVGIVLMTLWVWWLSVIFHPTFNPAGLVQFATVSLEVLFLLVTLLWTPALLAGTLAGDKEAGTLGLLLVSRTTPYEIVMARLAGRFCRLAVVLAGGFPLLALLLGWNGLEFLHAMALLLLPLVTAWGAAGVSLFASAVSRRGRDALIAVYLTGIVLILLAIFVRDLLPPGVADWVQPVNPFAAPAALLYAGDSGPLWRCLVVWSVVGLVGTFGAALFVGPVYLRQLGSSGRRGSGRGRVPPLGDNPMLWKELYIDRVRQFGRVGQGLAMLLVGVMLAGSVIPALIIAWHTWREPIDSIATGALLVMEWSVGYTAVVVSWLVQWAIGLRAAVSISSERQQGTWDGLLTSPLEGREIVSGKLWGSLFAMRWLLASLILSWTLAVVCGAISPGWFAHVVADTILAGAFMAAVGIWISLSTTSTTEAMASAIGAWIAAAVGTSILAGLLVAVLMLAGLLLQEVARQFGSALAPTFPFDTAYALSRSSLYLLATFMMAWHCWSRFDYLAGRGCAGLVLVTERPTPRIPPRVMGPTL